MLDAKVIRESLSLKDITKIVTSLGSKEPKGDKITFLIFQTVCHNHSGKGSYKLYYYEESKQFHCYTECGESFNVFELVMKNKGFGFYEAVSYVASVTGKYIEQNNGLKNSLIIDDWDFISNYNYISSKPSKLKPIPKSILKFYDDLYYEGWINEGIDIEAMKTYNIKFDISRNKIVIPHYDIDGELVGIRGRALNEWEVEDGKKYMPMYIKEICYAHNLGVNLYGLHKTKETIRRLRKAIIFEGEKSVYLCEKMYGDNNFSVACCGSSITTFQRNILLDLGVEEIIVALDKQYHKDNTEESENYAKKLVGVVKKFVPYFKVYILWDTENLLDFKDAPCDKGQEVLEKLMKNKIEINEEVIESYEI